MAAKKASKRDASKRKPASVDPRAVFRRMIDGELVFGRSATKAELAALRERSEAWDVFVAFLGAVARSNESDQRLLKKLSDVVADHFGDHQRRIRFLGTLSRALDVYRRGEVDRAVDAVCTVVQVEVDYSADAPFMFQDVSEVVREHLASYHPPDRAKPATHRGDHTRQGERQIAGKLARHFGILGIRHNDQDPASKFKNAVKGAARAAKRKKKSKI